MSVHAIYNLERKPLMAKAIKWLMEDVDVIMPLANRSKRELVAIGIPEKKNKSYNQWVNQLLFKPRNKIDCRRGLCLDGNFFALFVGRLIEKKGVKILIDVAKKLPEIKFVFVGNGPMLSELKAEERQLKNIYVVGSKNQEETALYYGASDVVIIPSQYEEGFARVVLEALSSGRLVIAANKGCLPEMITCEAGILIEPTVNNIARQIKFFYKNRKELKKITDNCRKYACHHFSENNAMLIEDAYQKV